MSTITINNETDEAVRIAIYKKPVLQPTLNTIAWQIAEPPPTGGQTIVQIPSNYEVYGNYSYNESERNDPNAGNRTGVIEFSDYTSRFTIDSVVSQDRQATSAVINQSFSDLVMNEVRIENNFGYGIWTHVTKDGDDVYAPQILWPGAVRMEDVRSTFYLAVVSQFVYKGDRLVDEEISLSETPVLEGGVVTVTGSVWEGYSIK